MSPPYRPTPRRRDPVAALRPDGALRALRGRALHRQHQALPHRKGGASQGMPSQGVTVSLRFHPIHGGIRQVPRP